MPRRSAVTAGALCLLLGIIAPVYAQQHEPDKESKSGQRQRPPAQQQKPPAQQQQRPPAQHQAHTPAQNQRQPQQIYGGAYHGGVQANGPTYGGVHHSGVPQHQGQVRSGFVQSRARSWNNEHKTWQQRGGYNGYRVPDDRFRAYFGSNHYFRIYRLPMTFIGGYPRFMYDGYWVTFVDPWPETWGDTWYETDDVYIDYVGDGYYLYDRMHPGIGIAITITF
jgi:hypothetical protein